MPEREQLERYVGRIDVGIRRLLSTEAEEVISLRLQEALKECTTNARVYFKDPDCSELPDLSVAVLHALRPVADLLQDHGVALETHKDGQARQAYEALAMLLVRVDYSARHLPELARTSFYAQNLSQLEYSVNPWINKMLTAAMQLVRWVNEHEPLQPLGKKLAACMNNIQQFMQDENVETAAVEKIRRFHQLSQWLRYDKHLPPKVEKTLQEMWQTLETHSPPDMLVALQAQNQNGQIQRDAYFSSRLPEKLKEFERLLKLCKPKEGDYFKMAFSQLHTLRDSPELRHKNKPIEEGKTTHVELVKELMALLNEMMSKLDLNPEIAESRDEKRRRNYDACWCVVQQIGVDAIVQYAIVDTKLGMDFPQHPFRSEIEKQLVSMTDVTICNAISKSLDVLYQNNNPAKEYDTKKEAINQIMFMMAALRGPELVRDFPYAAAEEMDALAGLLFAHGTPDQQQAITSALDYSIALPRKKQTLGDLTFTLAAQLDKLAETQQPDLQNIMKLHVEMLERLAENPEKDPLLACLNAITGIPETLGDLRFYKTLTDLRTSLTK
jgi:hypothetical protein